MPPLLAAGSGDQQTFERGFSADPSGSAEPQEALVSSPRAQPSDP